MATPNPPTPTAPSPAPNPALAAEAKRFQREIIAPLEGLLQDLKKLINEREYSPIPTRIDLGVMKDHYLSCLDSIAGHCHEAFSITLVERPTYAFKDELTAGAEEIDARVEQNNALLKNLAAWLNAQVEATKGHHRKLVEQAKAPAKATKPPAKKSVFGWLWSFIKSAFIGGVVTAFFAAAFGFFLWAVPPNLLPEFSMPNLPSIPFVGSDEAAEQPNPPSTVMTDTPLDCSNAVTGVTMDSYSYTVIPVSTDGDTRIFVLEDDGGFKVRDGQCSWNYSDNVVTQAQFDAMRKAVFNGISLQSGDIHWGNTRNSDGVRTDTGCSWMGTEAVRCLP